jgi:hypothetical protein
MMAIVATFGAHIQMDIAETVTAKVLVWTPVSQ